MTNNLVGEVYAKIIEDVILASTTDFEESGVSQATLQELRQEWQSKLSQRGVAHMPWEPKLQPTPTPQPTMPSSASNGLPSASYSTYETPPPQQTSTVATTGAGNGARIKTEPGNETAQYNGLSNGYSHDNTASGGGANGPAQGGLARAAQLVQQQYGPNASASLTAMQRGLALPGGQQQQQQQQQQAKPQGLHLPGQGSPQLQQAQFSPQQQQQAQAQAQAQAQNLLRQQQQAAQTRIKVESESPQLAQGGFAAQQQQQAAQPNYGQTDGAGDEKEGDAYEQWREMLAQRRAVDAEQRLEADRLMHDHVVRQASDLTSGLMVPLDELLSVKQQKKRQRNAGAVSTRKAPSSGGPVVPQLDGDFDEDEEKPDIKDEDDENAINSDLDDSDDDGQGQMGDDDDEFGDQILCTYDKVQRVKNKWKCVLKDGVMSVQGKEWVFHKGNGEFEW